MTTNDIETYADIGGISSPDINLKVLLRRQVVPAFFADVGYVSWRRKVPTLTYNPGDIQVDLPDDFAQMQVVALNNNLDDPLLYIGEDPDRVIKATANTTPGPGAIPGKPGGYFLTTRGVAPHKLKAIRFDCLADTTYTVYYSYYTQIHFADDTTDVDLDPHIPTHYQWGLVDALKAQIMYLRFGIGDPRYVASEQAYGVWVGRASENPEMARRNFPVFVR